MGEAEVGFDVALAAVEGGFGVYAVFDQLPFLQRGLGFFLILPEIRIAGFGFELG